MTHSPILKSVRQVAGSTWLLATRVHRVWRSRRRPRQAPPILVVGSLRAGGSGKTDWVDWIARRHPELAILVHPTGDEDHLLETRHPGRVFRDTDLLRAWESASRCGFRAAVSDGGLQDPALDGSPAILLGEEFAPRADLHPFGPFRQRRPVRTVQLALREGRGWDWIRDIDIEAGTRVLVAAGVAKTDSVIDDLRSLGIEVAAALPVRDHARFRPSDIRRLERVHGRLPWVVTAKDEARGDVHSFDHPVHVLHRELVVSPSVARSVDLLIPGR